MKKILVIQLKQIGDVLLSSPVCNTLKKSYPNSQIDYIIYDYTYGVVEKNPNIDNIIKVGKKERESKLAFLKLLMSLVKYDICINIQGKLEGALITLFSGAKEKISWDKKGWNLIHTHPIKADEKMEITGVGNTIDHRLALLSGLEGIKYDRNIKIWVDDIEKEVMKKKMVEAGLDLTKPIVSFGVTSRKEFRVWQKEKFAKLINALNKQFNIQSILFYAPEDKKYNSEEIYCNNVKSLSKNKEFVFTNIKTKSVRELLILLSCSDMYIGNDNGPRHFAQAVGTPSFAIFTTVNNKKSFCPHSNARHKAIDIEDSLGLSQEQIIKYMNQNKEKIYHDVDYKFVEKSIFDMIRDEGIFNGKN